MFFERRLSDKGMCDPPTRPKPPSLLYGGRYSAEANAARAERWRALAALQMRGAETAGRKAHASDATDAASAASAASVAACDAREAPETELGTHDANATRCSHVVVPTPTPELESEAATWAKRVPWSRVNVVRQDTESVADGGDSKKEKTEKDVPEEDASGLVATSVDFPTDEFVTPPVPCTSPLATARVSGCLADEVVVGDVAASPRRLFRLDSSDDAPRGSAPEEDASPSGDGFASCSFTTAGADRDDWDALGVVHEAIARKETHATEKREEAESGSPSGSGWNPSSDDTASSGWTSEIFSERSSSSRDDVSTFPRSALFSPLPRACSRAFREAVEAVEREDERRTREAERFVDWLVKKDGRDGSRDDADAENVDPETVAAAATSARADAADVADVATTREKNAAAFAALRRSLELNSPPAPPPVRTRVAPRETKKKKPLAARSSPRLRTAPSDDVSVPAEKVPRPSSSSRDAKRFSRRDEKHKEKEKTSWEPEKTWPPLPAAEPDETAVAEEEAEVAAASGGVAKKKPEDEKDATKTNDETRKQTYYAPEKAASSSSVWAAIVAADSDAAKTTELVAETRNKKDASSIPRAEKETLEVFEETAPAVLAADAREEAKSLFLEDDDAEAMRRRCEAAAAALEDAVRLALDARAAAAACAPGAAAEMDTKMASSARALSGGTRETALTDATTARFFDAEECFAPGACVFVSGGTEKEHVPRVCRWRSAHGSSFALGPAADPAADPAGDSLDSESRLERAMERVVERCLAKFGDGIVRAVRASSQASPR